MITKHVLDVTDRQSIGLTSYKYKVLSIQVQEDELVMWIDQLVDTGSVKTTLNLVIVGTGMKSPKGFSHVETVQMPNGCVWHIYKEVL